MEYHIKWLLKLLETEKQLKYLFFWGHHPSKNGDITASCFSQWWEQSFIVEDILYKTAEHYMMAQKALLFKDSTSYQKIIASNTAAEAKNIGREVENFDEILWDSKKYELVKKGNFHKFSQNKDLQKFLLSTNHRILVETSPVDKIWGIGLAAKDERAERPAEWKGLNLLGFALMEVRDILLK
jgi:ribA/ribD-fused uncharacterized protein